MPRPLCPPEGITAIPLRWPVRLMHTRYRIHPREALNCDGSDTAQLSPDAELATHLKRAINRMTGAGIDTQTGRVDYAALRRSDAFADYRAAARSLRSFDLHRLTTDAEKLAFWLNLYNALVVHAIIAYGVRESVTEIGGLFERAAYVIGGYRFSADDIEHGILRANAGHPALPGPRFGPRDPRRAFCLQRRDPRIHFAVNCAAASCPPIGFYDAQHVDRQLAMAARHFAEHGGIEVDRERRTVRLSRLFSWYAGDFGGRLYGYAGRSALLRTVSTFLDADTGRYVAENAERLRVIFQPYDWSLNS